MTKTALITGGNSGIGYSIAERLLADDPRMNVCLACRNEQRATAAVNSLRAKYPAAAVDYVLVDVSLVDSVLEAAADLKARYSHINLIYLNAGILPVSHVDWSYFFRNVFTSNCASMFTTGDGLLLQHNGTTRDGFKDIFATNVFGHFVLIKELSYIIGGEMSTKIIWTSSSNAKKSNFSTTDIQHSNGRDPYSSSKYLMDVLTVAFNSKFNKNNVYCYTTCPGLVITNLSFGILPQWFWSIFMPILLLMRIIVPTITYTPFNGSEAGVWLSRNDPIKLNSHSKFISNTSVFNRRSVKEVPLRISEEISMQAFNVLSDLERLAKEKLSNH